MCTDKFKMRNRPAASSRLTMPRLAFNRKDTGRIDWRQKAPATVDLAYPF
jgi:hypothetical protein